MIDAGWIVLNNLIIPLFIIVIEELLNVTIVRVKFHNSNSELNLKKVKKIDL
jgi:hypothetical protein